MSGMEGKNNLFEQAIADFYVEFDKNQKPLDIDMQWAIQDNIWELYECD